MGVVAPEQAKRDRECRLSLVRPSAMAFVFVAHAILLGSLFLPVAPMVRTPKLDAHDAALQVRFYFPIKVRHTPQATAIRGDEITQPVAEKQGPTRASIPEEDSATRPAHASPRIGQVDPPASPAAAVSLPSGTDYIPGGGALGQGGEKPLGRQSLRVPGDSTAPHAPRFRMVDPRTQGIGGVVRFIGGLTGAVDSHCLDLEAWQGMTPAERIANRVSSDDMQKIADRYDCRAPHRRADGVK